MTWTLPPAWRRAGALAVAAFAGFAAAAWLWAAVNLPLAPPPRDHLNAPAVAPATVPPTTTAATPKLGTGPASNRGRGGPVPTTTTRRHGRGRSRRLGPPQQRQATLHATVPPATPAPSTTAPPTTVAPPPTVAPPSVTVTMPPTTPPGGDAR